MERQGPARTCHQQFVFAGVLQIMGQGQEIVFRRNGVRTGGVVFGIVDDSPDLPVPGRTLQRNSAETSRRGFQLLVKTGRRGNFQVAGIPAASGAEHEDLDIPYHFLVGFGLCGHLGDRGMEIHGQHGLRAVYACLSTGRLRLVACTGEQHGHGQYSNDSRCIHGFVFG